MKNNTTRLLTIGLASVILTSALTACKINRSVNINANVNVNGEEVFSTHISTDSWEVPYINKVSVEDKKIFEDAVKKLDGYFYEPVALLGTQVVSGTNYCFLCKPAISANNAMNSLVLTYIYVDLQGNASFEKDERLVLPGTENADGSVPMSGGWSYAESTEITSEVRDVLNKAMETLTGKAYEGIAYVGSQVVAGRNHAILCKTLPSVSGQNTPSSLVIVYVYEDLQGNCEITGTTDVELGYL